MIKQRNNTLEVQTPYDAAFVAALKNAVPTAGRRWDAARKIWLVDPQYGNQLAHLLRVYFNANVTVDTKAPAIETKPVKLEYLGACKSRNDGNEPSAFGYVNGGWNAIFPESVLREWFGVGGSVSTPDTLYGALGLPHSADMAAIKTAYRRLAKQWHPDVCREQNAAEMFRRINDAYEVLRNPATRRKYDAGLLLTAGHQQQPAQVGATFRAPLRCGWLLVDCTPALGRIAVAKIKVWEDIVDAHGRTMVASWPMGADMFSVMWL